MSDEPIAVELISAPKANIDLVPGPTSRDVIERIAGELPPADKPTSDSTAASAYSALILDQLTQARDLASSIQQRALAVITTSGTLVTLIFAFGALSRAVKSIGPPTTPTLPATSLGDPARELLVLSLFLFITAVAFALYVQDQKGNGVVISSAGFQTMLSDEAWTSPDAVLGAHKVAAAQVDLTIRARQIVVRMARFLNLAIGLEIAAVVALTITVGAILFIS
jgi:hypothetical protein